MRYDEQIIEQVRNANDIVDVIGQHVRLTRKGAYYFGLCPFHGEKTASFSVSPGKQIFHCFGCGVGGNVISFLMQYENYSFQEALNALADRAHITLPEASFEEDKGKKELYTAKREDTNQNKHNDCYAQIGRAILPPYAFFLYPSSLHEFCSLSLFAHAQSSSEATAGSA